MIMEIWMQMKKEIEENGDADERNRDEERD